MFRYKMYKIHLKREGEYEIWKEENRAFLFMWNISQIGMAVPLILLSVAMLSDNWTLLGSWSLILFFGSVITTKIAQWHLHKTVPKNFQPSNLLTL